MPIALLMIEHRLIERMVPLLRAEASNALAGSVDPSRIDALVDFVRIYADKLHHGKEEDILFAAVQDKPAFPELKAIMEGLIDDHVISRTNLGRIMEANASYRSGNKSALLTMAEALEVLAELYPRHIETEDRRFFIQCMDLFTMEEKKWMLAQFKAFDQELVHRTYKGKINALSGLPLEDKKETPAAPATDTQGERWVCTVCDHIYDSAIGDPENGIPPGTRFEDLPEDWGCPLCGAQKKDFRKL